MNRRKFFKKFAISAAAITYSPMIIAEVTKPKPLYPSLQTMTLNEFNKMVKGFIDYDLNFGKMVVYGTGCDRITATGFALYCTEMKKKGREYDPLLMFNDESALFPKR